MSDVEAFERVIGEGGVVVFGADTVYGLACDPEDEDAVRRLYALKGRVPDKPAAVLFGSVDAVPDLPPRARALLPGPVTLLIANPRRRFPLACGPDPGTLGVRVPDLPSLRGLSRPVLQSSANHAGAPDARRLADVPEDIRAGADLVLDAGELPGTPSTVIDLRGEDIAILREGAVPAADVVRRLSGRE